MNDAAALVGILRDRGQSVATAESLTGGSLAATLTSVPGASAVYVGSVVAYATQVKVSMLGVPADLVEAHGVVSEACAAAMAEGVRSTLGTDWGIATTGVAGPSSQEGQPVGTVFIAVAGAHGTTVEALHLAGSRTDIRAATVDAAVTLALRVLPREEPAVG